MVENQEPAKDKKIDPHEVMMSEFGAKRAEFSGEILKAAQAFKNTRTLLEAEHILYGVRQNLVDYKRALATAISELNKSLKKLKQARMMAHKENKIPVVPANATERKIMDDAYFSTVTETIEKFDTQFEWVKDSINGCDEMGNGISYYVKLANLLGGSLN